ncbi:DMT family transporter [Francisella tularensis subsp. novicida]|uniref:DMT family transporter n=1 Tax=Francisella tularensis TaxID=263 RepID=UPI0008FCFA2A|nr:DMT family transporter [Francisella tularensis]APC95644.1 eamA-like transporter family protein [Francisella tularensis subsp. novicida]MBK2345990.1 DMT family transporter [Francisella tularensis subsp. novicida]
MNFKKRAFVFGSLSGIFWGLDYTLAGQVHTLLTMTFLVSMWLTSIHDLGVAATIAAISTSSVKRIKDLKLWQIISICCIPLLGGFAMTMYMLSTRDIATGTAIIISSCYPAVGMIGARIFLKESLTTFKIVGFIIVIIGITLTATNQLYDKSNSFVGLSFAILAAIFWGLEGVIYKMLLNANIAINTLLFLRKISTIIIFLPFTWAIIHSVNISVLLLTLAIGIIGYIADLSYMKAFKHSNVTLAMSLNITYIIWGPLFALLLFDQNINITITIICAILIFLGNFLIFKSKSVY